VDASDERFGAPGPAHAARAYRHSGWWRPEFLDDLVLGGHAPDAPALRDAGRALTRAELRRAVAGCAHRLRALGVAPGDAVITQLTNGIPLFVLVLALVRIGARPVLTPPQLREHELDPVIAAVRPTVLAMPRAQRRFDHLALARRLKERHASVRMLLVAAGADAADRAADRADEFDLDELWTGAGPADLEDVGAEAGRSPSDVALYLLSSGTTGAPKPIPRTHEAFGHVIRTSARVSGLDEDSVYLAVLPATHSFAFSHPGVLGTLCRGGRAVLAGPDDPAEALRLIAAERVTHCALSPAVLLRWLQAARQGGFDTSSLAVIQVGGARLDPATAGQAHAVLGGRIQQVYGMSEGLLNFTRLDDPPEVIAGTQGRPASPGDETLVVDPDGVPVAAGAVGELITRGPSVITAYHGGAAPASFTADGYYRTGDLVRREASGNFVVMGRVKDVINRGGEKIPADELEALVLQHPGVGAAAAVAMPHAVLGEAVCLYLVPSGDAPVDLRGLRRFLTDRGLAAFKLPERLVEVDALPLVGVGKVDKVELRRDIARRLAAEPRPAPAAR